jgi:hypothetical protein
LTDWGLVRPALRFAAAARRERVCPAARPEKARRDSGSSQARRMHRSRGMKNLIAIGFIWVGCAVAWMVLGSTITYRSGELGGELTREVHLLWGPPMWQDPPRAIWRELRKVKETVTTYDPQGRPVQTEVEREKLVDFPVPLDGSDATVKLALEHRRKGLLWFPTYGVDFQSRYTFHNDSGAARDVEIHFPLVSENAIYDGFGVAGADGKAVTATIENGMARFHASFAAGEKRAFQIRYRSRGTGTWHYRLANGTEHVKDFKLVMKTDFAEVDFPAGSLSPSAHEKKDGGWEGAWTFSSLVASQPIGVELPQRLNPGPLAAKITWFAPVSLLFFFFVVAVFATARGRRIHPLNYFFFGLAFFAFHLLFAYLVDHLSIAPAFALSAAVSIFLVVTYARLFVGWGFATRVMGLSQALYLVLFSVTFFWQGFTGLAITVGAVLTLFVMMQLTGRVDWAALSRKGGPKEAATG